MVLFDEPCSALDPISTYTIEETIRSIAEHGICAIIVTHNMEQAARVSDRTAFFYLGDMVETGDTKQIFSAPRDARLADYLTGGSADDFGRELQLWYGDFQALKGITLEVPKNQVTAFIALRVAASPRFCAR